MIRTLSVAALTVLSTPALAQETAKPAPILGTMLAITATGEAHRVPDLATVTAGVVTQGSNAGAALADNARRMTVTVAAIRKAGVVDRDVQTSAVRLQPQYRYGDNQPPVLTGYQTSNQVPVRMRDLARAGSVIDALVAAGANQIDGPNLSVDKPETALDEARTAAVTQARSRATLYAQAAGLRLKRIVSISEEGSSGGPVRPMPMMAMARKAETPIEPGEETLSVNLRVVFELE